MKRFIRYIGVVDTGDNLHQVKFEQGLNIVTGKSSTGKSAILEIFDYCLGSSEDTIPVGIITERAELFFVVWQFSGYFLVTARKKKSNRCFLLEQQGADPDALLELIKHPSAFFAEKHFMHLTDYIKGLGRYFSVTLENIDEDPFVKLSGRKKAPTPSVRSFSSFMLQHQNLVANKHAIFYRFDEKEKRDQAINHFKIFMGLVDEAYFDLVKEQETAKYELKRIEAQIPKQAQRRAAAISRYEELLAQFKTLAGVDLTEATAEQIYARPSELLNQISARQVRIDVLSNEIDVRREALSRDRAEALFEKRQLQGQLRMVSESVESAARFSVDMNTNRLPDSTELFEAHCPVCDSQTSTPAIEANKLVDAIEWLNGELTLSTYARESFAAEGRKIQEKIDAVDDRLRSILAAMKPIEEEAERLKSSRSIDEQATKSKLLLEIAIQEQLEKPESELESHAKRCAEDISRLTELLSRYRTEHRLAALSQSIDAKLCQFGDLFSFEETYKPSRLRFNTETFELWYQQEDGNRVYLRSMGSGANWLYSHLALFLALHYQFAAESKCKIPPILFLDQPTQVYFPAALDDAEDFSPKDLAKQSKRETRVDEDMSAVNNMFTQLARFCDQTARDTGVMPQIIVSDHADKLTLGDGYDFKSFVRATWRTRGFIA
ncbi:MULTISPECIES: DUF3732 domain-containing protein [Xanthomonas]|uniref:DUF3732 domain-containing protein n=1 Tax=Xanthomonas TaxID=338 RepID=UPI0002EE52BB|nr:DUF3732 domain-containing protein [Xanthomonas euvesicatoria]PPU87150.1 DUF3732 domain-containing protein [Xanthomonas euvesicatoria pv. citrumelonis]TKA14601.1 hypothetical protein TN51_17405 [Xanthomonas euvesicatoria pv. citrumelonis]